MTDRRGDPSDFYTFDTSVLPSTQLKSPPPPAPSFVESVTSTFRAAIDAEGGAEARMGEALDTGYAELAGELTERGVKGRWQWRDPRKAWALSYDRDAIWAAIAAARASDPKAFADLPATQDAYEDRLTAPLRGSMARDAETAERSGWAPWLIGQLGAGLTDPVTTATLPLSAGGQSVARVVVNEALLNARIAALEQPVEAIRRGKQGKELTAGEAAANVGLAGLVGGVGGGLGAGLERAGGGRLAGSAAELAARMRERIGWERMTDRERAAVETLEREAAIAASSPNTPGAGTEAHIARVERTVEALRSPDPGSALPPEPRPLDIDAYLQRNRAAESSGNDAADAAKSSAYGRYQFLKGTWLRYYKRRFGETGESDAAILAKRGDGAVQDMLMRDLTADNRRALARIGAPETMGNLYLMHFAGQGGASKILRADPDTPIDQLLPRAAIEANGFLRGKSAGEVIEWAHAKMGDAPSGAVLRRGGFDSDEAWAAAQREVDAAERALADAEREAAEVELPGDRIDAPAAIDPGAPTRGLDWDPGERAIRARRAEWREGLERLRADQDGELPGALWNPATGEITVRWGKAGDPANDWRGGHGIAHILAKHPEMEELLDELPDLVAEMRVKQRWAERLTLETDDHTAGIALTWHGDEDRWLVTAFRKDGTPDDPTSGRGSIDGRSGSPDPGGTPDIVDDGLSGNAGEALTRMWAEQRAGGRAATAVWGIRDRATGELLTWSVQRRGMETALARMSASDEAAERMGLDLSKREFEVERITPRDTAAAVRVEGFGGPGAEGAVRQTDSLEHDARMAIAAEGGDRIEVRLSEEGPVVTLAEALDDIDADFRALDAARACMKPGGAA